MQTACLYGSFADFSTASSNIPTNVHNVIIAFFVPFHLHWTLKYTVVFLHLNAKHMFLSSPYKTCASFAHLFVVVVRAFGTLCALSSDFFVGTFFVCSFVIKYARYAQTCDSQHYQFCRRYRYKNDILAFRFVNVHCTRISGSFYTNSVDVPL